MDFSAVLYVWDLCCRTDRQTDTRGTSQTIPARKIPSPRHLLRKGGGGNELQYWELVLNFFNTKNTCLQGRMKLSTGVISYSHGNNSWFGIFCKLSALWLCLVGGKLLWGVRGYFCNEHLFLHQPAAKEDLQRMAKKIFD